MGDLEELFQVASSVRLARDCSRFSGKIVSSSGSSITDSSMTGILSLGATGGPMGGSSSMMVSMMVCFSRAFLAFLTAERSSPGFAYDPSGFKGITMGAEEFLEVRDVE